MAKSSWGQWSNQERNRFNTYGQEGNKKAQDYMLNYGTGGSVRNNVPYQQNYGSTPSSSSSNRFMASDPTTQRMVDRRKNAGNIAIDYQKNEGNQDYSSMMGDFNIDPYSTGFGKKNNNTLIKDPKKPPPESWASKIMGQFGDLGLKDYGDLAVRGLEAYTGFKELDQAEKQHELATNTFQFQKAAWNKDYAGRQLAYNTNADNVNAWKQAQGRTDFNKLMV